MTPYECFCEYLALKNHFTTDYDYIRYSGQMKSATPAAFEKRKDKYEFTKLSKQKDPTNLMIANFIKEDSLWVGDINSAEGKKNYQEWEKRNQSLSYVFKNDLKQLKTNFNENFIVRDKEHPYLLKLYLAELISIESFVILLDITKCPKNWDQRIDKEDIVWEQASRLYNKYRPFIKYDKKKFHGFVMNHFSP